MTSGLRGVTCRRRRAAMDPGKEQVRVETRLVGMSETCPYIAPVGAGFRLTTPSGHATNLPPSPQQAIVPASVPNLSRSGYVSLCVLVAMIVLAVALFAPPAVRADEPRLLLGTTVGLERSGLLAVLLPPFERQTGRKVTTVAVSAPQALGLGARGELDVLLVDASDDEPGYLAAGHAIERRLVLHAD